MFYRIAVIFFALSAFFTALSYRADNARRRIRKSRGADV